MKPFLKVTLIAISLVIAPVATADDKQFYVGAKIGSAYVSDYAKALSYGVYGGMNFDKRFGVEIEATNAGSKAFDYESATAKYTIKNYGVYGTYRHDIDLSPIPLYAKGRLGVNSSDLSFVSTSPKQGHHNDTGDVGLGMSVGVGYAQKGLGVEAMYSHVYGNVGVLGVGVHLDF